MASMDWFARKSRVFILTIPLLFSAVVSRASIAAEVDDTEATPEDFARQLANDWNRCRIKSIREKFQATHWIAVVQLSNQWYSFYDDVEELDQLLDSWIPVLFPCDEGRQFELLESSGLCHVYEAQVGPNTILLEPSPRGYSIKDVKAPSLPGGEEWLTWSLRREIESKRGSQSSRRPPDVDERASSPVVDSPLDIGNLSEAATASLRACADLGDFVQASADTAGITRKVLEGRRASSWTRDEIAAKAIEYFADFLRRRSSCGGDWRIESTDEEHRRVQIRDASAPGPGGPALGYQLTFSRDIPKITDIFDEYYEDSAVDEFRIAFLPEHPRYYDVCPH